jgi:hypothetical protein
MTYPIKPPECKWALPVVDSAELVFASWVRVIESAPIKNRPALLRMMARDAASWADAQRQQAIDDIWEVATELGLVTKFGVVAVQDAIASGFAGGAS